jgi:hypothetical protein
MSSTDLKRSAMNGLRMAVVIGMLAIISGCLLIPVDYHTPGSRHNISPDVRSKLVPGVTSKEEVLLMLGEPDYVSEDGQDLGYAWSKVKLIVVVAAPGGGGDIGEWGKDYVLHIVFDANNRVAEIGPIDSRSQTWK